MQCVCHSSIQERPDAGLMQISVRWVDVNKGDADDPDYRCRLVVRKI